MQSPTGEPVDIYLKAKSVLSSSQSAVDALSQFMAARADLERTYANALTKLAKTSLNVDETSLHPAVFEAIASLRGDVANEARQHSEMFTSINKDVLEPLASLKETADMVVRVVSAAAVVSHSQSCRCCSLSSPSSPRLPLLPFPPSLSLFPCSLRKPSAQPKTFESATNAAKRPTTSTSASTSARATPVPSLACRSLPCGFLTPTSRIRCRMLLPPPPLRPFHQRQAEAALRICPRSPVVLLARQAVATQAVVPPFLVPARLPSFQCGRTRTAPGSAFLPPPPRRPPYRPPLLLRPLRPRPRPQPLKQLPLYRGGSKAAAVAVLLTLLPFTRGI